jgi:hypothetical protein
MTRSEILKEAHWRQEAYLTRLALAYSPPFHELPPRPETTWAAHRELEREMTHAANQSKGDA